VITHLKVGLRVMLPSGNIVNLLRREGASWVCEYHVMSRQRGEVEFMGAWLRRFGRAV
jgi:hypothetical protein